MEGDTSDTTGMQGDLGETCVKKIGKITVCAQNIGEAIAKYYTAAGGYHLMGFQEAANFEDLGLTTKLRGMSWVRHAVEVPQAKGKFNNVVSMYNVGKMGKHAAEVKGALKSDLGRPYLILIFDKAKIMHINIHNCQQGAKERPSWRGFPVEMEKSLSKAFKKKPKRKTYRVILTGDFNDMEGKIMNALYIPCCKLRLK